MNSVTKAAVWHRPGLVSVDIKKIPELKSGEILVRVESCAICGSDLRILKHGNARVAPGTTVGHEISGTVAMLSEGVSDFIVGDRLSIGADVPCGKCSHCLAGRSNCCDINYAIGHQFEGGFSEYMVLNALTLSLGPVRKLKSETNIEWAALAEPLACCINGFERGLMESGKSVVIFGAGPIGIMLGMLAQFFYKSPLVVLIDPNESRLKMALHIGAATHTLIPTKSNVVEDVMQLTDGAGAEMIFTACPVAETHELAIAMVAKRGVVNLFGGLPAGSKAISLNSNHIHYREAYITGSHGSTPEQHTKALDLIERGVIPVGKLITHRLPLDEINQAYEIAASGEAIKVLIKPQSSLPQ